MSTIILERLFNNELDKVGSISIAERAYKFKTDECMIVKNVDSNLTPSICLNRVEIQKVSNLKTWPFVSDYCPIKRLCRVDNFIFV